MECQQVRGRNTKGTGWSDIKSLGHANVYEIKLWDAFTIEKLNESYGHLLDAEIPEDLKIPDAKTDLIHFNIRQPDHINDLIKWSNEILGPTFEHARKQLDLETGTAVKRAFNGPKSDISYVRRASIRSHNGGVESRQITRLS